MQKLQLLLVFFLINVGLNAQATEAIKAYLDAYAQHDRLSGTVLVKQAGQTTFQAAYGCSDYQKGIPNTLETVFNIGSLSKQFTAAAILHLVEAGKVNLNTAINEYLGPYASKNWKKVTVHHLLTHTSGIPSLLQSGQGLDHVFPEERVIELAELISFFQDLKLRSKPGRKYSYNNSGYVLLAAIIEQVSGQSYGNYLETYLFQPNGLTRTSHSGQNAKLLALAHYNYTENQRKAAPALDPSWFIGAGSIYSTIGDLARWNQFIHSTNFLNADLRAVFFKPHKTSGNDKSYAYGWEIIRSEGKRFIHHDGTTFGYTCDFLYEPKTKKLSIILTNQTHESLSLLGNSEGFIRQTNYELLQIVDGKEISTLPSLTAIDDHVQAGIYQFQSDYKLSIQKENGEWMVEGLKSPLIYAYERPLVLETPLQQSAGRAVDALVKKRFWKFAKEADGTLKTLSYLGIMRLGLNSVMKGMGKWQRAVLYDQQASTFYYRVFCENGIVDFSLHYNEKDKIQGVFDFARSGTEYQQFPKKMTAKVTAEGLYLNGFAYGNTDITLRFTKDKNLLFKHGNRVFKGKLVKN
ncbi:MAG: hypothetical protein Sapg2KO_30300 [Saprospiraceae bacterium]